jgi:hypothetical protein
VATVALTYFDQDTAWRIALGIGGLPLLLMLFVPTRTGCRPAPTPQASVRRVGDKIGRDSGIFESI